MYKCYECEKVFEEPKTYSEDKTPYGGSNEFGFIEYYKGCPYCGGTYGESKECCLCEEYKLLENGEYTDIGFLCNDCLIDYENEKNE